MMSENNDTSNDSNSLDGGGTLLTATHPTRINPLLRGGVLRPSVLGPSVLSASVLGNSSSLSKFEKNDKDLVVKNPFLKDVSNDEDDSEFGAIGGADKHNEEKNKKKDTVKNAVDVKKVKVGNAADHDVDKEEDDVEDRRPDPLKSLRKNGIERANMFAAGKNTVPSTGFVFGQNVHERVVGENIAGDNSNANAEVPSASSNSSGDGLFSSVMQHAAKTNGIERINIFAAAKSAIPRVESSGFVFGQNVHERVVGENITADSSANADSPSSKDDNTTLLFSSVIQNAAKTTENNDNGVASGSSNVAGSADDGAIAGPSTSGGGIKESDVKSLTEVAREYEESRAQKRKFEEVETFTGEEDEINIADVNCKLFAFVKSNWEERGRGSLRLNDSKKDRECSRVVFRTSGNLRLLLNTKVWAGMVAERPSQKSLRLTAMDNTGKIKVFLAMARPAEMGDLHNALTQRIELRRATHPEECGSEVAGTSNSNNSENANAAAAAIKNGNDDDVTTTAAINMRSIDSKKELNEASKINEPEQHEPEPEPEPEPEDCTEPSPKKLLETAEVEQQLEQKEVDEEMKNISDEDNEAVAAVGNKN